MNTVIASKSSKKLIESTRLHEVDFLRVSAIILVILYHTYIIFDLQDIDLSENLFTYYFKWILNHVIVFFRLPLLIFVGGYMFAFLKIKKNKYLDTKLMIKQKFKRLLLPYIIFAPITFICYNLWRADSTYSLLYPIGHLWFIVMMFWCFLVTQILDKLIDLKSIKVFIPLMIMLSLCYPLSFTLNDYFGFASCLRWLWCFILGFGCYSLPLLVKLRTLTLKHLLFFSLICTFCIVMINYLRIYNSKLSISLHSIVMSICVITIWGLVFYIGIKKVSPFWTRIIKCSYGMYVVHMWILSIAFYNHEVIFKFANGNNEVLGIGLFIIVLMLSFVSSFLMLKTRFGQYLIG